MTEPHESQAAGSQEGGRGPAPGTDAPTEVVTPAGMCGDAGDGIDCEMALRELSVYLDGEITEERRLDIQVHIEECGPCLQKFDFEAELRQLVAKGCRCEAPDALRDRVARAILDCEAGDGGDTGV